MKIGVLALQGAFIEHIKILEKLGVKSVEIRQRKDFAYNLDGLILPGGESTAIGKLLNDLDLLNPIQSQIVGGLPVFGTCAGMILLAKEIDNQSKTYIATMDATVVRNAYGRQYDSFNVMAYFNNELIEMPFIRAPYIKTVNDNVQVLATVQDRIVAIRQDKQLATSFHPELTNNTYVHEYFLSMLKL
ncbi:MAG: glutamine amidotransferase subunit PdxT [Candidatus Epulonipiscioides saccharophilum]|nr:MAG: glutamine amidotransferase subunit PdxT [Epulopiscium sp. AS2M-Bin001]